MTRENFNITDFKKLETLEEKLDYWESSIMINYIEFLQRFNENDMYHLHKFKIQIDYDNKEIWEPLNLWILKNYESMRIENNSSTLLNIKDLKNKFGKKLLKVDNDANAINDELKYIDESFIKLPLRNSTVQSYHNSCYYADYGTYHDYLAYNKSPNYSILYPGLHVIDYSNGKVLAEYRIYLQNLLKKQISTRNKNSNDALTSIQVCLLLHYTGILDALKGDFTVKAKLFSELLDIGYKSMYDKIRAVSPNENNKSDLEAVLQFMSINNLNIFSNQLKKDIKSWVKKQ